MKHILVVEDDRAILHLVREILKDAKYTVETAADGEEGLRKLREKPCDLILLDIWMPRINGLEFLAELRKQPTRPPVIVMTADNAPDTVLKVIREQALRYIAKPLHPKSLLDAVTAALAAEPIPPIEVVSAKPDWVELLVPCSFEAAERIQEFLSHLEADLPQDVRESVGRAFRELVFNAVEWGGHLDPKRKVRVACLRTRRMLLYRVQDPGPGFRLEGLTHAAVSYPPDQPFEHVRVREEKGMRTGGFGIVLAQATVDELLYNEARNEVVFIKYLE